jgi:hypothetical protein
MNSSVQKGTMKVGLKNENGFTLTKEYGFTVQEENGSVLAFDLFEHPELGTMLLFGNQVFAMKFWSDEQLAKALNMISTSVVTEWKRRGINTYDECFNPAAE